MPVLCRDPVSGFQAWLRAIPTVQARAEAEAELRGHTTPAAGRAFIRGQPMTTRTGRVRALGDQPRITSQGGRSVATRGVNTLDGDTGRRL